MDEYLVYVNREGHRFYYKNGEFHRENGPAIFRPTENQEILEQYNEVDLTNNGLYKEVFDLTHFDIIPLAFSEPFTVTSRRGIEAKIIWGNGIVEKYHKSLQVFGYWDMWFYLNGDCYPQDEYDFIMKQKKIKKEYNTYTQEFLINNSYFEEKIKKNKV
jgi:hypothetical protein